MESSKLNENKHLKTIERVIEICSLVAGKKTLPLNEKESLFSELDFILDEFDSFDVDRVLSSPAFQSIKSEVHKERAMYEYDREMILADRIIHEHSLQAAENFRSHDWYDKALTFETNALAPYNCKKILFVGSGPFPTSPMAFLRHNPGSEVTCIERSLEACKKARDVAKIYGLSEMKIIHSNGKEQANFEEYDCVIIGLVVGVTVEQKREIAAHFLKSVPNTTLLCMRSSVGPGRIIYPCLDSNSLKGVNARFLDDPPHKSFTMAIIDRSGI